VPDMAVCYIDLLGFSKLTERHVGAGVDLLGDYNDIISSTIDEDKLDDDTECTLPDEETSSFLYFLPMSDSIFITSQSASTLVVRVSSFLSSVFMYTGYVYANGAGMIDPREVSVMEVSPDGINRSTQLWHPSLFRGGCSYGDVKLLSQYALVNGHPVREHPNLAGPAITAAVNVEKGKKDIKGPRLFCNTSLYERLTRKDREYYIREDHCSGPEILWPIAAITDITGSADQLRLVDIIKSALGLLSAFWDQTYGGHYIEFFRLVVRSAIRVEQHSPRGLDIRAAIGRLQGEYRVDALSYLSDINF